MSKGSRQRPTDYKKFAAGWDAIYSRKKQGNPDNNKDGGEQVKQGVTLPEEEIKPLPTIQIFD